MIGYILIAIGGIGAVAMFLLGVDRIVEFACLGRKRDLAAGLAGFVLFIALGLIIPVLFPIF